MAHCSAAAAPPPGAQHTIQPKDFSELPTRYLKFASVHAQYRASSSSRAAREQRKLRSTTNNRDLCSLVRTATRGNKFRLACSVGVSVSSSVSAAELSVVHVEHSAESVPGGECAQNVVSGSLSRSAQPGTAACAASTCRKRTYASGTGQPRARLGLQRPAKLRPAAKHCFANETPGTRAVQAPSCHTARGAGPEAPGAAVASNVHSPQCPGCARCAETRLSNITQQAPLCQVRGTLCHGGNTLTRARPAAAGSTRTNACVATFALAEWDCSWGPRCALSEQPGPERSSYCCAPATSAVSTARACTSSGTVTPWLLQRRTRTAGCQHAGRQATA